MSIPCGSAALRTEPIAAHAWHYLIYSGYSVEWSILYGRRGLAGRPSVPPLPRRARCARNFAPVRGLSLRSGCDFASRRQWAARGARSRTHRSTHVDVRPQDGNYWYCAARNRYNLAPYLPCGAQRYTRSSAGLQRGGPYVPPQPASLAVHLPRLGGLETHVRPQEAMQYVIRNTQYAIRNTQYATHKGSVSKPQCRQYTIRNTQYAIRNTQYAIRNTQCPSSAQPIRDTQYAVRSTLTPQSTNA